MRVVAQACKYFKSAEAGGGKNLSIFGENLLIFSKKKVITLSFEANEGKF